MLEFKQEMLIPKINGKIYFAIYELENWLRRICLTIYMQSFGEHWILEIPRSNLSKKLKETESRNLKNSYLEADNDKNIIWVASLGELVELLSNEKIKNQLEFFLSIEREDFFNKIKELKKVRNLLAHNRALTSSTEIIVNDIIEFLRLSIISFKSHILYNRNSNSREFVLPILDSENASSKDSDEVIEYFFNKAQYINSSSYQPFIEKGEYLYSLVCLPVPRDKNFPSAYELLNRYKNYIDLIIAFLINKEADEYSILISNKIRKEMIKEIIDIFLNDDSVWTSETFVEQNPKYACHPKIWFYENRETIYE